MTSRLITRICSPRQVFLSNSLFGSRPAKTSFDLLRSEFHATASEFYAAPIQIKMPALSPTMTEGTIVKWHKKEGDKIQPGDLLFEVQTDKAIIPYELEEEGTIAKIMTTGDSKPVKVGELIGLYVLPGDDWKSVSASSAGPSADTSAPPAAKPEAQAAPAHSGQHHAGHDKKIGPAARILLESYQIDPNSLTAIGPHGFISKSDVKAHILKNNLSPVHQPQSQSVPSEPQAVSKKDKPASSATAAVTRERHEVDFEDIELTNMRKVIAKRLLLSKTTIPHSYMCANILVDKIVDLRKEMIKNNQKVSINDFIIKALALALRMVPELNSIYDSKTECFNQLPTVDISVAVATDNGLITPIVKNADKLSVVEISETVKVLADKARQGKLMPHEFQGGSFSISNLGMFGITEFSAVINPPQTGIMAVGKSQTKFNTDMKLQTEVAFTLSYDERGLDLDRARKFMNTLGYFIANPQLLVEQTQSF